MSGTKKVFRIFTSDNYDKEEFFLTRMSASGWHFVKMKNGFYTFEEGNPQNYVYRLDYKKDKRDDLDNYLALYRDYGWENIFELQIFTGAWEYFRKEGTSPREELFTDNESKIELLIRIRNFYILIAAIYLPLTMNNTISAIRSINTPEARPFAVFSICLYSFIFMLYLKIFLSLNIKLNKLRK